MSDEAEWPTAVATIEGWRGVVSLDSGREGWHGYAAGQMTVYHRVGDRYDPVSPSVTMTTYRMPRPRRGRSEFVTEAMLLNELLWRWADGGAVTFPIEIKIDRSTLPVVIAGRASTWLVVECERLWVAGVHLADTAIVAVGRHLDPRGLALAFTPVSDLRSPT